MLVFYDYSKIGNIMKSKLMASLENIAFQTDTKIVDELTHLFSDLKGISDNDTHKFTNAKSFFTNPKTKKIYSDIDAAIFNRFGIHIHHVANESNAYGVLSSPPMNMNVLAKNIMDLYTRARHYLGKDECRPGESCYPEYDASKEKPYEETINYRDDIRHIINNYYESMNALEKKLSEGTITIDLKNAKIKGLPEEYRITVSTNPYILLLKYKNITPKMMATVLLHEVGHMFTFIEYSYRTQRLTQNLLDTIQETATKGYSLKRILSLTWEDTYVEPDETKDKREDRAVIRLFNKYMQETIYTYPKNKHWYTDSEQIADQFAGRFGLSSELSEALYLLNNEYAALDQADPTILGMIRTIYVVALVLLALIASTSLMTFIVVLAIYGLLMFGIMILTVDSPDSNYLTYDLDKRRFKRMRNEVVHTLRTIDLSKEDMRGYITNIEVIDKIISKAPDEISFLEKVSGKLPWNKAVTDFKYLEQKFEDLTENNLHLATAKLKTL